MNKKLLTLTLFLICCFLILSMFSGCINEDNKPNKEETIPPIVVLDNISILPNWKDGKYHNYYETVEMLSDFKITYPDLVNIFSIGDSILGKNIWCIKITNEKNKNDKLSCLIDGCIHGNEWEGGEACLYLAEYLLINYDKNKTITNIVNNTNIYLIPIVNPDGRTADERLNDNGVDTNRNFDIFFGKLFRGYCYRLGKLFGRIKIPVIKIPPDDPLKWFWNCGRYPFSEPESKALSDFIKKLAGEKLSFYVNCNTPLHNVITPWVAYKPPFEKSEKENKV